MVHKSILFVLLTMLINLSNFCLAMEFESDKGDTYQKIVQAMGSIKKHKECHVNIFRLVESLKTELSDEELKELGVIVLRPSDPRNTYEGNYLPNSSWFHHVALIFNDHVFDFFHRNSERGYAGQNFSDYIYENFFDFRNKYKSHVASIVDPNLHRGFSSLNLIEPYRRIGVQCTRVLAEDYLACLAGETMSFKKLKEKLTWEITLVYDKKTFLRWYKKQFNGVIDESDTLLLWADLCDLHWEAMAQNEWDSAVCRNVTESFNWSELEVMQKRWENRELFPAKYYDIVRKSEEEKSKALPQ